MIDLYYWTTPNGHKITIFLEEAGLSVQNYSGEHQPRRSVQARVPRDLPE